MPVPVVTPTGPLTKRGKETQVFTATNGVTSWTATGGTFSAASGSPVTWTAPNKTGTYTLKATNADGDSNVVTISVVGVFPLTYSFKTPRHAKKRALIFDAESGARQATQKGPKRRTYDLTGSADTDDEYLELEQFWDDHMPNKKFYFNDAVLNEELQFYFDAELKSEDESHGAIPWSTVIKEA